MSSGGWGDWRIEEESLNEDTTTTNDIKDLMAQATRALQAAGKEEGYRLFSKAVDLAPI